MHRLKRIGVLFLLNVLASYLPVLLLLHELGIHPELVYWPIFMLEDYTICHYVVLLVLYFLVLLALTRVFQASDLAFIFLPIIIFFYSSIQGFVWIGEILSHIP
jgi:hypothetical protein